MQSVVGRRLVRRLRNFATPVAPIEFCSALSKAWLKYERKCCRQSPGTSDESHILRSSKSYWFFSTAVWFHSWLRPLHAAKPPTHALIFLPQTACENLIVNTRHLIRESKFPTGRWRVENITHIMISAAGDLYFRVTNTVAEFIFAQNNSSERIQKWAPRAPGRDDVMQHVWHMFHAGCIVPNFMLRSPSWPVCR